jgi:hypothetical protein
LVFYRVIRSCAIVIAVTRYGAGEGYAIPTGRA